MFNKNKHHSNPPKPVKILFFIVVFVGFVSLASFVVMLLWNAILPDVTGVKPLNFWQAAGLLVLTKILFGGFKGRGKGRKRKHSKEKPWNKWMNMNEEEREEAKQRWKEYCQQKKSER